MFSNKSENNLANNQSKFTNGESENLIFHLEEATKQLESSKDLLRMQNERNQQYRQEVEKNNKSQMHGFSHFIIICTAP